MDGYSRDRPAVRNSYINDVWHNQIAAVAATDTLTVTNGRVKGDHKTPNPFSFTKTEWVYPTGTRLFGHAVYEAGVKTGCGVEQGTSQVL